MLNGSLRKMNELKNEAGNSDGAVPLTKQDTDEKTIHIDSSPKYLIYGIRDSPPIHITIMCGLQVIFYNITEEYCSALFIPFL